MKNKSSEARVLGTTEAAKVLGVCPATLLSAIASGDLPAIRIGHRYKIPRVAIDRLLGDDKEAA